MEITKLIAHYKNNYAHNVFLTKLTDAMQHAYIMYLYNYDQELENFSDTLYPYCSITAHAPLKFERTPP